MKKKLIYISALSIFACMNACSDDSGSGTSANTSLGKTCDDNTRCDDNLFCEGNICVSHVNAGDNCDSLHLCTGHLVCNEEGICATKNGNIDDPDGPNIPDGQEGASCDNSHPCQSPLVCDANHCHSVSALGGACVTDISCNSGTCVNGICSKYVKEEAECDPDKGILCEEGLRCHHEAKMCFPVAQPGEPCLPGFQYCAEGYECIGSLALCMVAGNLGDSCNLEEYKGCQSGMECIHEKCRKIVTNNCSEYEVCKSPTAVCYDGKCIESHTCASDDECQADTYCCTEDACDVKNVCLPYGEGPRPEVNDACVYQTVAGLFEAAIQCEWNAPAANDPYPNHANVLMTPLVMDTPYKSGTANEIIFTTYNSSDGSDPSGNGTNSNYYGVIRIINAETCELHASIFDNNNRIIGGSNIAAADVDNDGYVEIFAARGRYQPSGNGGGIVAFHWDDTQKKYITQWKTDIASTYDTLYWGGPSIHDINNDGIPEIIGYGGEVFNALTGKRLNKNQTISTLQYLPTVGDLDNDGQIEIVGTSKTYRWNSEQNQWVEAYNTGSHSKHLAYADFGSFKIDANGNPTNEFEYGNFDGKAEIVSCGANYVRITTLNGNLLFRSSGNSGGGPCTIGDFDKDGKPEVATAFGDYYTIFDPECHAGDTGCSDEAGILWRKSSQDLSSASTGSSLFDFDGDGAMEAVYADECFTRIYDGKTGDVLFSSYHSSLTWHEYPVIADVDNDESAEIVVGSNNSVACPEKSASGTVYYDPIHRGLRCASHDDCKSKNCVDGLCRCNNSILDNEGKPVEQCNFRTDMDGNILDEYGCTDAINTSDAANGKVCRAKRVNGRAMTGVRVMRDSLDRWTSSRNIWNQHVYTVNNITDDQTIPKTEDWVQNFTSVNPKLNNFRQNIQGARGHNVAPDITGKLDKDNVCAFSGDNTITLHGVVCNRGKKMVAARMPATFYDVDTGEVYCTSHTTTNVPIGECKDVYCSLESENLENKKIRMVVNDDGNGGRTTVECNTENNTDEVVISGCVAN